MDVVSEEGVADQGLKADVGGELQEEESRVDIGSIREGGEGACEEEGCNVRPQLS